MNPGAVAGTETTASAWYEKVAIPFCHNCSRSCGPALVANPGVGSDCWYLPPPWLQVLDAGITSVAVVLKHAAIYPEHEKQVGPSTCRVPSAISSST
jgi:hypothetical protein